MSAQDIYDLGVEYLAEHPEHIRAAWDICVDHDDMPVEACALFQFVHPDGGCVGCLTQVCDAPIHRLRLANGERVEDHPQLASIIREVYGDSGIPRSPDYITPEHLPLFAEWQRYLDLFYNYADRGLRDEISEKHGGCWTVKQPSQDFLAKHRNLPPLAALSNVIIRNFHFSIINIPTE